MLPKTVWKHTKSHLHYLLLNGSPSGTSVPWWFDPSEANQMQLAILKKQIWTHLSYLPWQKRKMKCKEKFLDPWWGNKTKATMSTYHRNLNNVNATRIPWIAIHWHSKAALQSQEIKSKQEKHAQNEAELRFDLLTLTGKMLIKTKLLSACTDQQVTIQEIIPLWCPKCALFWYQQFLWPTGSPVQIRAA